MNGKEPKSFWRLSAFNTFDLLFHSRYLTSVNRTVPPRDGHGGKSGGQEKHVKLQSHYDSQSCGVERWRWLNVGQASQVRWSNVETTSCDVGWTLAEHSCWVICYSTGLLTVDRLTTPWYGSAVLHNQHAMAAQHWTNVSFSVLCETC